MRLIQKVGPLLVSKKFADVKDPCVVFDGTAWHIFGSGGSVRDERWMIFHATAPDILGPWKEVAPATLVGLEGPHVAAPGVVFDQEDKKFHMAIQDDFTSIGGCIHYLVSDNGKEFTHVSTILEPIPSSNEAGLYDPHFSKVGGTKYMTYAGMPATIARGEPFIPQPDVYLARSCTGLWAGPWERIGKILDHDDIAWHHNKRDFHDYEWGIEGSQIVELADGSVLLNATCFIEEGVRGTRQRVFFAYAKTPEGPYTSSGPVLEPAISQDGKSKNKNWESGENGHASVCVRGETVYLFYQARAYSPEHDAENREENKWRYGIAVFEPEEKK